MSDVRSSLEASDESLIQRERRLGIELARDDAERNLTKEVLRMRSSLEALKQMWQKVDTQITCVVGPVARRYVHVTFLLWRARKREMLTPHRNYDLKNFCILRLNYLQKKVCELSEELCQPLAVILQKSMEEGVVPEDWKLANVCPVF